MKPRAQSLIDTLSLFALLLLTTTITSAQTLAASPNPVIVPAGQSQGTTTITWNTQASSGFVWVSIDGAAETLVAADVVKGSIELSLGLGRTYELRLYSAGRERILASVKVTVIEQPSSVGGPLQKSQDRIAADSVLKRTILSVRSRTPKELRCRGSADLQIEENGNYFISFTFIRSTLSVDPAGRNLSPGQCGWSDRSMTLDDQESLFQATNKTKGDIYQFNPSIPQNERFPDYEKIKRVLKNPNQYWSFFVLITERKHMFSEYSRQWIPIKPSTIQKGPRITRP